tara:strand:- start:2871 stop:3218 length:348 start_codon:yes stop_codon:yes gene_type:complete
MPYELEEDEVAFIIKPTSNDNLDDWDGSVATGVAVGDNFCYSTDVLQDLIYVATLCSAFLDLMEKDGELMDRVNDHRNQLLLQEANKLINKDKTVQRRNGEIINFNAYTKTKGNA